MCCFSKKTKVFYVVVLSVLLVFSFTNCSQKDDTSQYDQELELSEREEKNQDTQVSGIKGKIKKWMAKETDVTQENVSDSSQTDTKKKGKARKVKRPQAADYIQSAIDYADKIAGSGLVMDDEGNFFANELVTLYSCYGKDIKQIRRWGEDSFLILTKDGDVYHNTQLVSTGKNVVDILWKTNNVGVNETVSSFV